MRRAAIYSTVLLVGLAMLAAAGGGCGDDAGDDTAGDRGTGSGGVSVSPRASGTSADTSTVGVMSASTVYEADLGGIYQTTGFELREETPGSVGIAWVASPEAGDELPAARLQASPGVLEVWMSDVRRHADLVTVVKASSGPVRSGRFVAPPDDSLCVLRLALRDTVAVPAATVKVKRTGAGAGVIEVTLRD